ncbi:hypothetical protein GCK32_015782 [Trichostrongylus colubriformis]|uniref:Uncharacterized protein n=1 Tax=Trichostrongylus colubriformis TaxID=6319 RepID=A0AAN8IG11_TRICO
MLEASVHSRGVLQRKHEQCVKRAVKDLEKMKKNHFNFSQSSPTIQHVTMKIHEENETLLSTTTTEATTTDEDIDFESHSGDGEDHEHESLDYGDTGTTVSSNIDRGLHGGLIVLIAISAGFVGILIIISIITAVHYRDKKKHSKSKSDE